MGYVPPVQVSLTQEEKRLLSHISFDMEGLDDDRIAETLVAAGELAMALIDREAIPDARREFFTDPDLDDGRSKSPAQVFESNGTTGEDIFRCPHFLKYLRYFICGPDLPLSTVTGMCRILEDDAGTSGEVMKQLQQFVRAEVRSKGMDRTKAATEFFKLSHELGLGSHLCRVIRDAARTTR